MLIILNIVIILFLLGMAAIWSTYGLYSALLNLIVVICAGVIALALWEPTAYWLLGRMPAYAHGVGLLAPFVLALILLRGVVDRLCRMNVHVPRLADQIGGGAIGLVSGVLAMGMFLNGANFLPLARDAFSWEPLSIEGNKFVESDEGGLWLAVNEWSAAFFTSISTGSMSPMSGPSLAEARPDLAQRAIAYRMPEDGNQARSAHPDNIHVTGLYAVPATEAAVRGLVERATLLRFISTGYEMPKTVQHGEDGMGVVRNLYAEFADRHKDPEKYGKPSEMLNLEQVLAVSNSDAYRFKSPTQSAENFERFVKSVAGKLSADLIEQLKGVLNENSVLLLVDTQIKGDKPGTYDSDSALRLGITQVSLQTRSDRGLEMVAPIGFSVQYSKNSGARTFTQLVTDQHFSAFSRDPQVDLGLAFIVPKTAKPQRLFVRELRFDLTDLPKAEGQDGPIDTNLGAAAFALGVPIIDTGAKEEGDGGSEIKVATGAVKIEGTDTFAEVSELLPSSFSAAAAGMEYDKDSDPWKLKAGLRKGMPRGQGGQKNTIREIYVKKNERLVRIPVDNKKAQSLYGRAIGMAASLSVMYIRDQAGNDRKAIGYAYLDANNEMTVDVRETGMGRGLSVKDLPTVRAGETLYVYFLVPVGEKVVSFSVASEVKKFETPLEVAEGR